MTLPRLAPWRGAASLVLCTALASPAAAAPSALPLAEWRARMRENFFIPQPLPALAAETHRRFAPGPGVRAEAVTYTTQFGLRVPAILYLPDPLPRTAGGRVPGLVIVNGHGGDKSSWYAWYAGNLYARAGLAVLTYDPLGEGERNPQRESGTRAHDKIKGDERLGRRVGGLLMTDVLQAVSYLAQRPEVDARRIAATGYSLGSFILSVTGAMDSRLHSCVLVGGGNLDGPEGYWDKAMPMCQGLPYRSLAFLGDRPAALYALHADRGPTLIVNGARDTVVAIPRLGPAFFDELRERTAALRGSREGLFESVTVLDVSHRPFFLTRPVVRWLEAKVDLPNWTPAQIEQLPETRIGDWAARHAIPLDRLYANEEREGGTPALLNDVPGFTRDDTAVLGPAEWERRKDEFIVDSWVARAKAADEAAPAATGDRWVKSARNPMLSLGRPGEFDSQNLMSPSVTKDGKRYYMFYAGGPAGPKTGEELVRYQLGLAHSTDGETWTKLGRPLLPLGERDDFHVAPTLLRRPDGDLLKVDGVWHLLYNGNRADDVEHATSRDGITWEKDPRNPVFRKAYAPCLVQVGDELRMYYTAKPRGPDGKARPWELHLATGRDLYSLQPHPANPMLQLEQPWEDRALIYPYVLQEGATWIMFYASYWKGHPTAKTATAIGMATSPDGLRWTRSERNPVITPTPGSPFDAIYTSNQSILRDGPVYRLYYGARIDMVHKYYAFGLATRPAPLLR